MEQAFSKKHKKLAEARDKPYADIEVRSTLKQERIEAI